MSIQTITTILTGTDQIKAQLDTATAFARAQDAHLQILGLAIGLDQMAMAQSGLDVPAMGTGMEEGIALVKEMVEQVRQTLDGEDVRWNMDATTLPPAACAAEITRRTRFSDLVLHQRAEKGGSNPQGNLLAEAVLFDADNPLLLIPHGTSISAPPARLMVAWDESRAALRAARRALPLMSKGAKVHIVMVEPPKDAPDRSDPGGAFAQFLSRHGVKCEISVCNCTDDGIADTLDRRARELGCDMMIMGAYGHSRLRQAIFGGTTRSILAQADTPVFMAH